MVMYLIVGINLFLDPIICFQTYFYQSWKLIPSLSLEYTSMCIIMIEGLKISYV